MKKNKNNEVILTALGLALAASTAFASSRYLSGTSPVENQELQTNMNTQNIQANEQLSSGQMGAAQGSMLNQEQQNLNTEQRVIDSRMATVPASRINQPQTVLNQAQVEQINTQESSIDTQLSGTSAKSRTSPSAP